jgi:hypothetical protein
MFDCRRLAGVEGRRMQDRLEVFVQGEGLKGITLVQVPREGVVADLMEAARAEGLSVVAGELPGVYLEDADAEISLDTTLEAAGIGHRARVHMHRCRKVKVSVTFNGRTLSHAFASAATVRRVKHWADAKEQFNLRGADATEHALQLCGSSTRPDEDTHIGSLVTHPACSLCFDLVPKVRVEG